MDLSDERIKLGDNVTWLSGMGVVMTGTVIQEPLFEGARPKVRETRDGTILFPVNAKVIVNQDEPIGTAYMGDVEAHHEFDPNAVLAKIRKCVKTIDEHGLVDDPEELEQDFIELYENVKALDDWISSGHDYPNAWAAVAS